MGFELLYKAVNGDDLHCWSTFRDDATLYCKSSKGCRCCQSQDALSRGLCEVRRAEEYARSNGDALVRVFKGRGWWSGEEGTCWWGPVCLSFSKGHLGLGKEKRMA